MIILLYGPDEYRRAYRLKEINAEFRARHEQGAVARFSGGVKEDVRKFREFIRVQSMFDPAKLAILEDACISEDKELAAGLKESASRSTTTILISERNKPVGPFAFLSKPPAALGEYIKSEPHPVLEGAAWHDFIRKEAARRKVELSADAANMLAQVYAGDSWGLITELDKLVFLPVGTVERAHLEALDLRNAPDFWEMMNAFRSPSPGARLAGLQRIFAERESASKVFNMVAYQAPERIDAMAAYDRAIKSGKLEAEEALLDLAIGQI